MKAKASDPGSQKGPTNSEPNPRHLILAPTAWIAFGSVFSWTDFGTVSKSETGQHSLIASRAPVASVEMTRAENNNSRYSVQAVACRCCSCRFGLQEIQPRPSVAEGTQKGCDYE